MHRLDALDADPHAELRHRIAQLGILAWRLDASGRLLQPPRLSGAQSAWACSSEMIERIESETAEVIEDGKPVTLTLMPGCSFLLTPLYNRRRVVEWTAAMLLSPELFESEAFNQSCERSRIDPAAARRSLRPLANFSQHEVTRFAELLPAMAADLESLAKNKTTLGGFSVTLTEAYEHIELTHGLAGAVRDVEQPERFFEEAVNSLARTLPFGWIAISLNHAPWNEDSDERFVVHAGSTPPCNDAIDTLLETAAAEQPNDGSAILSGEHIDRLIGPDEQVVAYPIRRENIVCGVLLAGSKGGDDPQVSTYDTRLVDAVGAFVASYYAVVSLIREQQATFLGSMRAISAALDAKDPYTRGHSERVAHLAASLATAIGLPEATVERVHIAGLMHDVGKIGVPEAVLCKPGRLTDEEFDAIKRHPRIGHDILAGIPELEDILPGVLWHHERWDGRGYPDKLSGEDIPLMGRLLAIADTFDAMSSDRSYRPKVSRDKVLAEITNCSGNQFDPDLVGPFVALDFAEYDSMVANHTPQRVVSRDAA